jgi:uncharacterized protein YndB with AHSA1/START domain
MSESVYHATLILERTSSAPVKRLFAALADAEERAKWGTPSETATFTYDATDFRVGGKDVFLCGAKNDPQFHGVTSYFDIVPDTRIVSVETIATGGKTLFVTLTTRAGICGRRDQNHPDGTSDFLRRRGRRQGDHRRSERCAR